jgi:hypothetical protein
MHHVVGGHQGDRSGWEGNRGLTLIRARKDWIGPSRTIAITRDYKHSINQGFERIEHVDDINPAMVGDSRQGLLRIGKSE